MIRSQSSNRCGRSGQAAIIMVAGLFMTMGLMGFVVDLGWGYYLKQSAQAAADAAATAAASNANDNGAVCGAGGVLCQATAATCTSLSAASNLKVGCQYATSNGFTDGASVGGGTQSVTMKSGTGNPPNGPNNAQNYWVVATVSQTVPQLFLRLAGFSTSTVRASSTAGVALTPHTGAKYCMYALDPTSASSFFMSGTTSTLTNCGLYVNSSADNSSQPNSNAYLLNGSAALNTAGGSTIDIHGGANDGTYCSSNVNCHVTAVGDPLLGLATPAFSGCDLPVTGGPGYSAHAGDTLNATNKSVFVICDGLTISVNGTVVLNPGIYVLNGGGLNINSASTIVTGNGVMFYNTATGTHTIAPILISGGPNVTFSAPTSGTYRGILFYGDPNISYSSANQINGSSSPNLTGTFYFPSSPMLFTGTNSSTPAFTALIAKKITLNGNANFKWDSGGTHTGLAPGPSAYLMQ